MPRQKYYSPTIKRFLVAVLYHEAKARGIPMTHLVNELVEAGLKESPGWNRAQAQMRLAEEPVIYIAKRAP